MNLTVKIKKLDNQAVVPERATELSAGYDLTVISCEEKKDCFIYGTGLAMEIPRGWTGYIFPRSSIYKKNLSLANSIGVIDADYRGEIKVIMRKQGRTKEYYQIGDKVAQIIFMPVFEIEFKEKDELSDTARGAGGLGSTGN